MHAQRNQQSPNRPCFACPRLMLLGKRAGDGQISLTCEMEIIIGTETVIWLETAEQVNLIAHIYFCEIQSSNFESPS